MSIDRPENELEKIFPLWEVVVDVTGKGSLS